jgi:two-component system chemotaxis response regulator CheB
MLQAADQHGGFTGVTAPIRVMLCDDSAVIRSILGRFLANDQSIEVVARAANGQEALDKVRANPNLADIIILDVEMPKMDGLTALPLLLTAAPKLQVIIVSTLTTRGAATTLEALRLGAVDFVAKPNAAAITGDFSFQDELREKIRVFGRRRGFPGSAPKKTIALSARTLPRFSLLAIGSSTGGPQALAAFLQALSAHMRPCGLNIPVVLTQHMPPTFTPLLAEQLTRLGGLTCVEAADGVLLRPGRAYIAPGGRHLLVNRGSDGLFTRLDDGPPENFCRPSVDPMLRSAAKACDGKVLMLMLTGMGHDGLEGTRALVDAGGTVFAQDEESSVVWGMPGAVARAGLCHAVLPLQAMAERVGQLLRRAP